MVTNSNIYLITKEPDTINNVRKALDESRSIRLGDVCRDISSLNHHLSDRRSGILLVDIDPDPDKILSELSSIVNSYPEKRVVVVSSTSGEDLILKAMQAGARHFLRKNSLSNVLHTLEQLMPKEDKKATKFGSIISVFSASGGCGATTIALNIANELRLETSNPVLMVDLDSYYGTMSAYLGISGQHGLSDILKYDGQIDKHLIETSSHRYMKDFHVLPSFSEKDATKNSLKYERLPDAADACRDAYKYTVVDAPRLDEKNQKELARISQLNIVVFQVNIKDLKYARSIIASFIKSGIEPSNIIAVANRYKGGFVVRLDDVKEALGFSNVSVIRGDWKKAISFINNGKPLSDIAPWSGIRRDFKKLAKQINSHSNNDRI